MIATHGAAHACADGVPMDSIRSREPFCVRVEPYAALLTILMAV